MRGGVGGEGRGASPGNSGRAEGRLTGPLLLQMSHTKPYIRKKAVLIMYKVFLKYPESLRPAFPRLKEKLEDPDPGLLIYDGTVGGAGLCRHLRGPGGGCCKDRVEGPWVLGLPSWCPTIDSISLLFATMRYQVCLLLSPLWPWNLPSKGLVPFVGVGRKHQTLGPGCPLFTGITQ